MDLSKWKPMHLEMKQSHRVGVERENRELLAKLKSDVDTKRASTAIFWNFDCVSIELGSHFQCICYLFRLYFVVVLVILMFCLFL